MIFGLKGGKKLFNKFKKQHFYYLGLVSTFLFMLSIIFMRKTIIPVILITLTTFIVLTETYFYERQKFLIRLILFSISLIIIYVLAFKSNILV